MYLDEVEANGTLRRIVEHDPQLPQGFNAVANVTFWPGQILRATCDYNSMERTEPTYAGATHHNEMCNLYMIMWSELPVFWSCHGNWLAADPHGPGDNQATESKTQKACEVTVICGISCPGAAIEIPTGLPLASQAISSLQHPIPVSSSIKSIKANKYC